MEWNGLSEDTKFVLCGDGDHNRCVKLKKGETWGRSEVRRERRRERKNRKETKRNRQGCETNFHSLHVIG